MPTEFPDPFPLPLQGVVPANGILEIRFGPPPNEQWSVEQITAEMPTAPAGSTVSIRYIASLVAPGFSARRAAFAGEPPLFLRGGEIALVRWTNVTPNDIGSVLIIYRKKTY